MSELINNNDSRATIRWKLMTSASALVLMASLPSVNIARADEANRPLVWLEFGGQLSRMQDSQERFTPFFETMRPQIFTPSETLERQPLYSIDETGKISFQPENSDWVISASIRYGRSTKDRHVHQQTYPSSQYFPTIRPGRPILRPLAARFADTRARNTDDHLILDFSAGKDLGLGFLGSMDASSVVNLGVRIAQFRNKSNSFIRSNPDWSFKTKAFDFYYYGTTLTLKFIAQPYHSNSAAFRAEREFRGVGPSLSWNASLPFAGNSTDGELTLDWGLNAAILFGRNKTRTQHEATERYNSGGTGFAAWHTVIARGTLATVNHTAPATSVRSRRVTVPNVGGFAGISYNYSDAKISFGYKADFFFGAIDGGIDARKNENRAFYGPYASISIGLGD